MNEIFQFCPGEPTEGERVQPKGIDIDSPGNINGQPVTQFDIDTLAKPSFRAKGRFVFCFSKSSFLNIGQEAIIVLGRLSRGIT